MKRKMRKLLSLLISLSVMASGFSFTAFAAEGPNTAEPSTGISEEAASPDDTGLPSDVVLDTDGQDQPEDGDIPEGAEPSDSSETVPDSGDNSPEGEDPPDVGTPEESEETSEGETPEEGEETPDGEPAEEGEETPDGETPEEGEETPDGETPEAPSALDAFQAAVDALGETDDLEATKAALEACFAAYANLTEEEQAAVADTYTALLAYQEELDNGESGISTLDNVAATIGDKPFETLQEAIDSVTSEVTTITLQQDVTESVTINGKLVTIDLNGYTLTGESGYRAIVINAGIVTVENGTLVPSGSLENEGMKSSSEKFGGGCIYIEKGKLNVENCTFSGDAGTYKESASYMGAGKFVERDAYGSHIHAGSGVGLVTITNSTFENSTSTFGAVYAANKSVTVSNCTFTNNGNGLQLDNKEGVFDVTDCTFNGGVKAINVSGGSKMTLNVTDGTFSGFVGGPVINANGNTNITGGSFSENNAGSNGVVQLGGGSLVMDGTTLTNNTSGGAVKTSSAANITMKNVTATGNIGTTSMNSGGSVLNANSIKGKTVILENVIATGNEQTKEHGGAFYLGGSSNDANTIIEITGCTLTGNTAKNGGGAIYLNNKGTTTITDTEISGNTANGAGKYPGGGIQVGSTTGTVTLEGSTRIYNNETPKATVKHLTVGATADIALVSNNVKTDFTSEDAVQRATLVLNNETSFKVGTTTYTLTKSDASGLHYSSGTGSSKKYYWPAGYYTVTAKDASIYMNAPANSHTEDNAVKAASLQDAVDQAKAKNIDTVYICGNVSISSADEAAMNSGITFVRCQDHPSGHMFTISGDVTLDGAHIDGQNVAGNASMIYVPSSGHLTIAGETLIENGKNTAPKGNGGAIQLSQSGLTMTGGTIDSNSAREGGGIYAYSNLNGAKIVFAGGVISNNTATGGNGGGGAYIGYIPSEFVEGPNGEVTTFSGNAANELGGGVFLIGNTHHIYRAVFTGNKSYRTGYYYDGGAIYIQSGTTAHMKNVYVSGNTDSDPYLANNNYTAVAVCPTGELAVYELDGLLSVDNNGKVDIGVIGGGIASKVDPMVYLPNYAPGGGQIKYTYSNGTPADIDDYHFMNGYFKVQTHVSDTTKKWAKEKAEEDGVVITGNYATQYGAGIMTNGILKIGTETKSIKVEKVWEDDVENHKNDQILVYLTRDGEIVGAKDEPVVNGKKLSELTDEEIKELITQGDKTLNLAYLYPETRDDAAVVLNAANNWSYTWTNLDPSHEWGFVEASVPGYTPELGDEEKDTEYSQIANQFYIRKLTNTPNGKNTASLVIEKQAIGMDEEASYPFELTLKNLPANGAYAINVNGTLKPIYNNKVSFTLKSGEFATVEGLPEGFDYEVAEPGYNPTVFESSTTDEPSSIKHVLFVNMPSINIPVEKVWTDDLESLRPGSIVAQLMDGDYVVAELSLTAENGWKGEFTNIPKYDAEGNEIQYSVKEAVVPDNYQPSYSGDNSGLIITNAYQGGKLTLTKALNDGAPQEAKDKTYTFNVTGPNGYSETVTLKAGESKTLENLTPGTYTVVEDMVGTNIDHYTLEVTGEGDVEIKPADEKNVTITNTYEPLPGGLTIKKIVTGDSAEALEKEYKFRVVGPHYDQVVTIKGNGFATITGLTPGNYTVTELDASIDGYKHTVTVTNEGNIEVFIDTDETGAEVVFTNDYKGGSLILQKAVNADAPAAAFHNYDFRVVGPGYDEIISVPANGSVTLNGLKAGEYTVTEIRDGIAIDQYTLAVTGEGTAAVAPEQTATVTITNTYKPLPGGLTIHKVVTGISAEAYEKTYYFNVSGPNGYSNRVSITGSGSVTLSDLAPGTYTVTEEDASINNYVLTVTGEGTVEVPINGGTEITIRNNYEPPYRPERPEEPEQPGEEIPEDPTPLTPPDEEIPEEEVPLAPPEEEEEEEIPEEDIPLVDAPKTGSNSHGLMAALAALLGLGAALAGKKRKDDNV